MTLRAAVKAWLERKAATVKKPATLRRYEQAFQLPLALLGGKHLGAITDDDLASLVAAWEQAEDASELRVDKAVAPRQTAQKTLRQIAREQLGRPNPFTRWSGDHVTTPLREPWSGRMVPIDRLIAPLVGECWRLGLRTLYSCQGYLTERETADSRDRLFFALATGSPPQPQRRREAYLVFPAADAGLFLGVVALAHEARDGKKRDLHDPAFLVGRAFACFEQAPGGPPNWQWEANPSTFDTPLRVIARFSPADIAPTVELLRVLQRVAA